MQVGCAPTRAKTTLPTCSGTIAVSVFNGDTETIEVYAGLANRGEQVLGSIGPGASAVFDVPRGFVPYVRYAVAHTTSPRSRLRTFCR